MLGIATRVRPGLADRITVLDTSHSKWTCAPTLTRLKILRARKCQFTLNQRADLTTMPSLEEVDFSGSRQLRSIVLPKSTRILRARFCSHLVSIEGRASVQHLCIDGSHLLTNFIHVCELGGMRELHCDAFWLTDTSIKSLAEQCANVRLAFCCVQSPPSPSELLGLSDMAISFDMVRMDYGTTTDGGFACCDATILEPIPGGFVVNENCVDYAAFRGGEVCFCLRTALVVWSIATVW